MLTEGAARRPDGTRSSVLIVDDSPDSITALGELLKPHYQVRAVTTGERAIAVATSDQPPDLMLLDVMMPDISGFDVLHRLRTHPVSRAIPVIFVTALHTTDEESEGLAGGAVDYITKPFRPSIVLARVRTHLELKHARDLLADHNRRLEAEVERRMAENQLVQDVSIRALALVTEARDHETGNHIQRTSAYVRTLAGHLARRPRYAGELTEQAIDVLARSAPLHDIGKVGIPDHILLKPGRLDPDERTIMETHAALGADAIARALQGAERRVDFLTVAMEIARHHHERWDGSGYPDRLAGEGIPRSARLMAIADVFDALISRRVYKPPMPFAEAYEIIVAGRGSQFDPDVVECFVAAFDEMCAIASRYRDEPRPTARRVAVPGPVEVGAPS